MGSDAGDVVEGACTINGWVAAAAIVLPAAAVLVALGVIAPLLSTRLAHSYDVAQVIDWTSFGQLPAAAVGRFDGVTSSMAPTTTAHPGFSPPDVDNRSAVHDQHAAQPRSARTSTGVRAPADIAGEAPPHTPWPPPRASRWGPRAITLAQRPSGFRRPRPPGRRWRAPESSCRRRVAHSPPEPQSHPEPTRRCR